MNLKRLIPALLCATLLLPCCTDDLDEDRFSKETNQDDKKPEKPEEKKDDPQKEPEYVPTAEDLAVDQTLFKLLNLDYQPLATVKSLYNAKKYKKAADELLFYFKSRKDVVNPEVTIPVINLNANSQRNADAALPEGDYRFCIHSGMFYESYVGGLYTYYSFKGADGKIDWDFAPSKDVGTEWYQVSWHYWFNDLALAYSYTKDEKYFNAWRDQYSDWMEKFPCPSTGKKTYSNKVGSSGYKFWCELAMATRINYQAQLFYYFIPAAGFDFAWLTKFLSAFHETVTYSLNNLYYTEKSNIRFAQYRSHCIAGLIFPEFKDAQTWMKTGANQVGGQFKISFLPDGCLEEFDMGYHTGEVNNYRLVYNAAKANDKLGYFGADYLTNLYNACKIVADYLYPNYLWETFNEGKQTQKSVTQRWMREYLEMYPDDGKFKYLATDRVQGTKPTTTLDLYKDSGYYMFRSSWEEKAMMLIYKNHYNPGNMWHSHLDNNNISFYKDGRIFLPSSGSYTYGDSKGGELDVARAYHKAASNHNTITKNLQDIPTTNSLGKFLKSSTSDDLDLVVGENPSYPDLTHRRAVWMVEKSFFVIADAVYGTNAGGTINLNFHLCRDTNGSLGINAVEIDDYSSAKAYGAHTVFSDGNNVVFKSFSDTSDGFKGENGTSYWSDKIDVRQTRKYYRVNVTKKDASSTPRFITVIYPCSDASKVSISAEFPNAYSSKGETVKVTINGKTYNLSYSL